ncbi:proteasome assembly chaperone 1 [Myripristis murdjan]|uniref:Proteasome assembly chaperone 1 n=1 Tax=Myripristis murdjan TaxID=586833 RepID=A0A667XAR7_9TELE|nr:proteasome assembly chaperone 1 [Myripristis murdjan]
MATFFGEVVSVYSRAVEEDDEEELEEPEEDEEIRRELEERREVRLQWSADVGEMLSSGAARLPCSHLILAVGSNAARFLSVFVLHSANWDSVGHAAFWNEMTQTASGQAGPEAGCVFYRNKDSPSVLICQMTSYIAEDQLFQWTEKVFGCLQQRALNVTVLCDSPVAEYKSPDYVSSSSVPFLRSLQTSACSGTGPRSGTAPCPPLEQPNIVTGLPAAVLSYCQVHHIPAIAYQCYSDVISPDSITMETYKPVLTRLGKVIQLEPLPNADVLRKFVTAADCRSNLYI